MIKTDIISDIEYNNEALKDMLCCHLPVDRDEIGRIDIIKKSLIIDDGKPQYKLSLAVEFSAEREAGLLKMKKKVSPAPIYELEIQIAALRSVR